MATLVAGVCGVETVLADDESATVVAAAALDFGVSFTDGFVELADLSVDVSVSSAKPLIRSTAFVKLAKLSDDVSLPKVSNENIIEM